MFFFFLDFTISSFLEWMENFRRSFFFFFVKTIRL